MNYRANVSCVDKWRPVSTLVKPVCPDKNKVKVSCLHPDCSWTSSCFKFILFLIEERAESSECVLQFRNWHSVYSVLFLNRNENWQDCSKGVYPKCTCEKIVQAPTHYACDKLFLKISGGCSILVARLFVLIPRPLFCGGCTLFSAFPQ